MRHKFICFQCKEKFHPDLLLGGGAVVENNRPFCSNTCYAEYRENKEKRDARNSIKLALQMLSQGHRPVCDFGICDYKMEI